jgi:hypothetical protein
MPSTYAKHLLRALILIALAIDIRPASSSNLEAEASYIDHERAEQDYQIYPQIVDSSDEVRQPLPKTPSEKVEQPFSGTLAYNAFSQYNSYGLVIQPNGISSQPFLNLRYTVHKSDNQNALLNTATIFLTTWSDFSSNKNVSNPSSSYRYFTETDIILGANFVFYKKIDATFQLVSYVSPAGAYGFGSWARGTLLYNDSKVSSNFSLKPQVSAVYTLPAASSISLEPSALLFEPGITPNWNLIIGNKYQANFSLPIRIGLGSKYYAGTTFGFASVGPQLSIRLPSLSGKNFSTNLNLGYLYYYLGTTAAAFAQDGQHNQNVYNLGISVNF